MQNVRVGLIGCGGFMRYRLGNLLAVEGVEVAALCDPEPVQIERTKEAYPSLVGAPEFSAFEAMLAEARPDAVLIASPHSHHCPQVLASLAAGAHVLVEKPLGNSIDECRQMIEARDRAGLVGAISYQRHGEPIFREARRIVQSGEYGRLLMLNSHLSQDWLRLTHGSWRQIPSLSGGGQIHDSGSHMIDILLWITGERAEEVEAMMDRRTSEVDINSVLNIRFASGALGSLAIIGDAPLWQEQHCLWLENAALFLDGGSRLQIQERDKELVDVPIASDRITPDANFIATIRSEAEVQAPFECGLATMELTEQAWRAAQFA